MKVIFVLLLFMLSQKVLYAQLFTQRTNIQRYYSDTSTIGEAFGTTHYAIEFARGFGSLGDEQAWNGKFIGSVDFYRWNSTGVLRGVFSSEFSANPHNDISFNPRAIIWEQALVLQLDGFVMGLQHRCKHDIDNSDSTHGDTPSISSVRKRVLINSGLHFGWVGKIERQSLTFDYVFRTEAYFYTSDYRFPANNKAKSYEDIRGSLMSAGRLEYSLADKHSIFARAWLSLCAFRTSPYSVHGLDFNARLEGGYHLRGKQAGLDIFFSWERIFDETAFTIPSPTHCVSIGIRSASSVFF